ncbi:MAG: hypothetical protein V2I33_01130 [Kangiellaceae bacterium]|nr:hypothetical protein [Kangiellaceae bacterium]
MTKSNQQYSLTTVTDEQVDAFIEAHHPQIYSTGGNIEYQKAKIKMWLFYNHNQAVLHEFISEFREEIIKNILIGKDLSEAFSLNK